VATFHYQPGLVQTRHLLRQQEKIRFPLRFGLPADKFEHKQNTARKQPKVGLRSTCMIDQLFRIRDLTTSRVQQLRESDGKAALSRVGSLTTSDTSKDRDGNRSKRIILILWLAPGSPISLLLLPLSKQTAHPHL